MALAAPLCDFLDRFFNLTLLEAIIPVSEPEKKPLKTSSPAREDNKNIKLIKKSISEIVSSYKSDFKIKHNLYTLLTLQEIYSYISNKNEYKIYAHRTDENDINLVATLDSSKLKNLLNTKL